MRTWAILVVMLSLCCELPAQGFDWQPSPRRPYQAPTSFIGLDAAIGLAGHSGNLPYLEADIANPCCSYERGSGVPIRFGLAAEFWVAPTRAVGLEVGLLTHSVAFTAPEQSLVRAGKDPLVTRYELSVATSHMTIGASLRQRLGSSMFIAAAGLRGGVLLSAAMTNREVIVGAGTFASGTTVEDLPATGIADASGVYFEPYVSLGYDLPLSTGYYLQPSVMIGYTASSLSSLHPWHATTVGLGLRVMKGR
ncbi:MAG TPA: hypothetical protein DCZ59_01750 [Bacteroidetes bacterium]|nr:hypothetical protein [Bacteroidota bacterium]